MATMTIKLYKNCRLSNKYDEVYISKTYLDTYLATLTSITAYSGEEIYYTNNGTISIDNSGLLVHNGDTYNYMKVEVSGETSRYAFVNDITLVNQIAVITYEEDIWHTYGIKNIGMNFSMKNSLLVQADYLSTSSEYNSTDIAKFPKKLPTDYEGHNAPVFADIQNSNLAISCMIVVVASMYKLNQAGEVNERWTSNYLLRYEPQATGGYSPADSGTIYWKIDNTTLRDLTTLIAKSSDTQVRNKVVDDPNWNFEILDVKLIPFTMANAFFTAYLSAGTDTDNGLFTDFEVSISKIGLATDGTYQAFDTNIQFQNLMMDDWTLYRLNDEDRHTYNGIRPTDMPSYSVSTGSSFKTQQLGNMARTIPLEQNGLGHSLKWYFNANHFGNRIELLIDNTLMDLSDDFTFNIPVSVQSADITQQQKIARRMSNITAGISMIGSTISLGGDIASMINKKGGSLNSGEFSGITGTINKGLSIASAGVQLEAQNTASHISNKAVNREDVVLQNVLLNGLSFMITEPENETLINKMIAKYGYIYAVLINDITIFNTGNTHYVRFDEANLYGEFSQNIARALEDILIKGVILLT